MKRILLQLWFLVLPVLLSAQANLVFDSPESGNITHKACNSITFNAGYSYSSDGSTTMYAYIDRTIPKNIAYQSSFFTESDLDNRSLDTNKAVGTMAGGMGVSASGGATYQIPISIAPGIMGVQPGLSLVYNSQSGDGQLGMGWQLSGLSAISRVPKNYYHDGEARAVMGDLEDEYALDGNRLIRVSGTHGGNGAVYSTYQETFSKIEVVETQGNGPKQFRVYQKNGMIYEYGFTSDSRFLSEDGSQTVLIWRLNRVLDCHGNYMSFVYKHDGRSVRLDRIQYTGNSGFAPQQRVQFFYSIRSDQNTSYLAGSKATSKYLLTGIESWTNGSDIYRRYDLYYAYDGSHSYCQEIKETGSDGKSFNTSRFLVKKANAQVYSVGNLTSDNYDVSFCS